MAWPKALSEPSKRDQGTDSSQAPIRPGRSAAQRLVRPLEYGSPHKKLGYRLLGEFERHVAEKTKNVDGAPHRCSTAQCQRMQSDQGHRRLGRELVPLTSARAQPRITPHNQPSPIITGDYT